MTLTEILKSQGLTDEQIEKITGEMKQNKIFTAGEENLDIRFGKLKTDHEAKLAELDKANGLIKELQTATKGNEDLQGKIGEYQSQVEQLQAELTRTKEDAAIKVALLAEKAVDVDYLTFKLREKGDLQLDDKGEVKGLDDKIAALKTQMPAMFEAPAGKRIDENRLPHGGENDKPSEPKSLADALQQAYETDDE